jgi:SAM-dependent methyltransferase
MPEPLSVCVACAGRLREWRDGIAVCASCGTSHRPAAATAPELEQHYADYYDVVPDLSPLTELRLSSWAESLLPYRSTGRILEVGCGVGHFLTAARKVGFETWGTEISSSALTRLQALGFDVRRGDLPDLRLPDEHFDAVVLFEVIEHLPDPGRYLQECRRLLRPGGLLLLTTPNFDSLSRRLLGARWRVVDPEHLVLMTPRGMQALLQRTGFATVSLSTRNIDPVEVLRVLRGGTTLATGDRQQRVDACRSALTTNKALHVAKRAANGVLSALAMGDTLEARAIR